MRVKSAILTGLRRMAQLNCGISLRLLGSEALCKNPVTSANTLDRGDRSGRCRLRPQEASTVEGQNASNAAQLRIRTAGPHSCGVARSPSECADFTRKAASSSAIQLRVFIVVRRGCASRMRMRGKRLRWVRDSGFRTALRHAQYTRTTGFELWTWRRLNESS